MFEVSGWLSVGLAAVTAVTVVTFPRVARAEEPKAEYADGTVGCRQFRKQNAHELAAWEKQQPATPYTYPKRDLVLGAPWGTLLAGFGEAGGILAASLIPHLGAQLRAGSPAMVASLPWSVPFGEPTSCSRQQGSFTVDMHRPHRVLFEPGIVSSQRGLGFYVRPGYRYIHHPTDWVVGVGAGLGVPVEIVGNREPFRVGVGPEIVLHFGRCCTPSYFMLSLRYDRFFNEKSKRATDTPARDLLSATLGYTFF